MDVQCVCTSCQAVLIVDSQYLGCLVECPACSGRFVLQRPEVAEATPVAASESPESPAPEPVAAEAPTSEPAPPGLSIAEPAPCVAAAEAADDGLAGRPSEPAPEAAPSDEERDEEIVAQPAAPARGKQCPECGMQLLPGNSKCPECGYDADLAGMGLGDEAPRFVAQQMRRAKASPAAPRQRKKRFVVVSGAVTAVVLLVVIGFAVYAMLAERGAQAPAAKPQTRSATLSLDWPLEDRFTGQLTVDGVTKNVPDRGPERITFTLAPGKHRVVLRREGCKPIEVDLELGEGETFRLRPEWVVAPIEPVSTEGSSAAPRPVQPTPKPAEAKRKAK